MTMRQRRAMLSIKHRLAISNILMIIVPTIVTLFVGALCLGMIWLSISYGAPLGIEDEGDFYEVSWSTSQLVAEALKDNSEEGFIKSMNRFTSLLESNTIALSVEFNNKVVYSFGSTNSEDDSLLNAVSELGGEGFVSGKNRSLFVTTVEKESDLYNISIYATHGNVSQRPVEITAIVAGSVLVVAIILSIFLTNRFLTKFVYRRISNPLDVLSDGVKQIGSGNLDYHIEYKNRDEFKPICDEFNVMTARLKDSIEQLNQHEQSRRELLVGISHDLRSPLTSIRAYVEGLMDGVAKTPESQLQYLQIIKTKADDIDSMLGKLFVFSKMEFGEQPDSPEYINLDDEIKQFVRALSHEYEEKGLVLETGELVAATVNVDPDQLRRVWVNIVENSLKYKSKEKGTLIISLSRESDLYCVALSDDGPGVSESVLTQLFDPFFRADPSRNNPQSGSGLGLAIVSKIVKRMGGTVTAKSGENGGLTILIHLPKA